MPANPLYKLYAFGCRKCGYSRSYGAAPLTCKVKATSHALRLGHIVDITETDLTTLQTRIIETVYRESRGQEEAPF